MFPIYSVSSQITWKWPSIHTKMLVVLNQINIGLSHFYQGGQLSTNRDRLCTSESEGNAREEMVPFKMSIEFALSVYLSKNYM